MRIGLFTDTYPPEINGVANSTKILNDELVRHGHEVFVVTTYKGIGKHKWDEDHHVLRLAGVELSFLYGYVLTSPIHNLALREIKKLNLDVIHAQTEFGVGIFARICAKKYHIPLVSTYHTTYEDYTHYINFLHSKTIDELAKKGVAKLSKIYGDTSVEVIAPSAKTKELLENYKVSKDINIIPTGLALNDFNPDNYTEYDRASIRKELNYSDEDKVIIFVGRLAKEKSINIILKAFNILNNKYEHIKFLVVGGGPEFDSLVKENEELGNGNVKFIGPIPSVDIPFFYLAADAFVSASLSETQGITFIEALASGLPLLARHDDVLEDLIIEEKTGWYFKDENELAEKLIGFSKLDKEHLEEIKKTCIKHVEAYSSEIFYERIMNTYERVLNEYDNEYYVTSVELKKDYYHIEATCEDKTVEFKVLVDDYYFDKIEVGDYISGEKLNDLVKKDKENTLYAMAIRKLAARDRTEKEIRDYLKTKDSVSEDDLYAVIRRLKSHGYIDDERYLSEAVLRFKNALKGKNKIINELKRKGIKESLINEVLDRYDDEYDNACELANKVLNSLGHDSLFKVKTKISTKLIQSGFDKDIIEEVLSNLDYTDVELNEGNNLRDCFERALLRYKNKYKGYELKNKIYTYCAQKGYRSESITELLSEVSLDEQED